MPLNYQQIHTRIKEISLNAQARHEELNGLRQQTLRLLKENADRSDILREKVESAFQQDPGLRCALPLVERLDASFPAPVMPEKVTLIAADGSQVAPDRHAPLQYCLYNVGAVVMQLNSGRSPEVRVDSHLLFDDEVYSEGGVLTEDALGLQRDIAERQTLLDLAKEVKPPIIALTDGPVELWGAKDSTREDYRKNLEVHKSVLSQLQAGGVVVAGYVDKPGANLVVRTLEITKMAPNELERVRENHPLRGVTDRWLFSQVLSPGHRSAVFELQSRSRAHYTGTLALRFFYLNIGEIKHPSLVRIEIPRWVVDEKSQLDLLHAALLNQCRLMGARPYPYILHRAHETAVIKQEEKLQLEQLLALGLYAVGGEVGEQSAKQSAKELPGRKRIK